MDERERIRNKRRPRRRTERSRHMSRGFGFYLLVLTVAVAAGYLTTKYVLYPLCIGGSPADISLEKLIDEGIAGRIEERLNGIINGDNGDTGDKPEVDDDSTGGDGKIIEDGLPIEGQEQVGNGETPATVDSGGNADGSSAAGTDGADDDNAAGTDGAAPAPDTEENASETPGQAGTAAPEQYVPENSGQQAMTPPTEGASGYCVQYGSFTTEEAADKLLKELTAVGITARMVKKENAFKVVGQLFASKTEADAERQKQSAQYKDVFVISLS